MGKTPRKLWVLSLFAMGLGACSGEHIASAQYGLDQCRRVALLDQETGARIRGAEDLALDEERGRLFVSAYDRRAVENAARKRRNTLPQGGVYAVPLASLFDPQQEQISVASLASPDNFTGGLRPHGISFDDVNHELVFINRTYIRDGGKWVMVPQLQRIGANGEMFVGEPVAAHCAANDVAAIDGGVVTSFTHASCGFGAGVENIFRLKRSGVSGENGAVFDKAAFANGVAITPGGDIVMAATRERALLFLEKMGEGLHEALRIEIPGGPDNLSLATDGGVVAAAHPSMMKLMFNRKFGIGKAPSRIVKADPDTGAVEILFDDPRAELFSAATVAVETPGGLVAGSVTDEGLLVCQAAP
ncbi:MAG: hypothetical protein AAFW68_00910 [Pseudomonadota bacterium]